MRPLMTIEDNEIRKVPLRELVDVPLADKCTGCTENDCLVMLDDTCERGRKMGEKPSPNPEF